ncbi:MAG: stage III sporulation protein AG [Clostridium sp.]
MDFKKLIEEMKNLLKQKMFANVLIGVLVIAFLLIAVDVLGPKITEIFGGSQNVVSEDGNGKVTNNAPATYEDKQRADLEFILKQIKGVGEVSVLITYEGGEKKEIAYDSTTQVSNTEETDTSGGKRNNKSENQGDKVVMGSDSGSNQPFVVETKKPKVVSVMVVAEGANNSKVKYDLQKAVGDLFNVSLDKVNVFPKGE